jgi:hypothetical protein
MLAALKESGVQYTDNFRQDFVLGNIKARERMIARYATAGARRSVVIDTDHAAESLVGIFTKYGDDPPLLHRNAPQAGASGRFAARLKWECCLRHYRCMTGFALVELIHFESEATWHRKLCRTSSFTHCRTCIAQRSN